VSWTTERLKTRVAVLEGEPVVRELDFLRVRLGDELAVVFFEACRVHPQFVLALSGRVIEDWAAYVE